MPMWTWLVSLACGRFVENAGSVASTLFLVAAAALLVEAVRHQVRQPMLPGWWLWGAAAVAILFVTALSPSFKKGHSLSGGADTATSVAIAALAWLGYRILADPLPERRLSGSWSVLLQFSLVSLLLVSLKQPNVVLLVVLWAGVCAAGLRDPRRENLLRIVLVGCASVPAIVFSLSWRQFSEVHIPGGQPDWLPFGQWRWSMAHIIAGGLITTMLKAPAHFILMFVVVIRTLKVLRLQPRAAADSLLIITTVTFVGYTLFLFMVWVATNFPVETAGAGFPRYSAHLGVLGVLTLAVDFAIPLAGISAIDRMKSKRIAIGFSLLVAASLPVMSPLLFKNSEIDQATLRFAKALAAALPKGSTVALIAPGDNGLFAHVLLRYALSRPDLDDRNLHVDPAIQNYTLDPDAVARSIADDLSIEHIVLVDVPKDISRHFGADVPSAGNVWLTRSDKGWRMRQPGS
jgi:hypothetical protein